MNREFEGAKAFISILSTKQSKEKNDSLDELIPSTRENKSEKSLGKLILNEFAADTK